jgi:hypothetical protein
MRKTNPETQEKLEGEKLSLSDLMKIRKSRRSIKELPNNFDCMKQGL